MVNVWMYTNQWTQSSDVGHRARPFTMCTAIANSCYGVGHARTEGMLTFVRRWRSHSGYNGYSRYGFAFTSKPLTKAFAPIQKCERNEHSTENATPLSSLTPVKVAVQLKMLLTYSKYLCNEFQLLSLQFYIIMGEIGRLKNYTDTKNKRSSA